MDKKKKEGAEREKIKTNIERGKKINEEKAKNK